MLENIKLSRGCEHADVEFACCENHVVSFVCLIDGNGDSVGLSSDLSDGVDDAAVIKAVFFCGQHVKTVADFEHCVCVH